ncbi:MULTISPECIES: N,N-dimethylformamidase beta subunit family domain-containing protein [unclassified Mesorhizobium]|uniref:N,N-dimethylformamidase beta subunit family domain-containing protein n=1 Tax=unclassified Mesorhizobium TaxID=325217 RepID=UPI00112699A6|nr:MULTISPECIES: N,N-dimethylformamidase beta subunit family domain-containing protein [unclassified Mesorhizobium]TPJ54702.1 ThuA domain-containing protein [Mesorhizobium sp. B2-6-4]TPM93037.1 ThuA domain-containing protein [Mesorhizobium sp. B2-1-5]
MTRLTTEFPDFGLTPEQRRHAVRGHYYEWPGMDGERGEIWCYSDRFSYRAGETVTLHVSSTAPSFIMTIVRDGGTETKVFEKSGIPARWQESPDQCSAEGCGWEASFEFSVGSDWPSGAYRVTLTAEGRDGKPIQSHHLFIVAPLPGKKPGRVLQVAATGTWLAYNTWGGSNHYQGITGPDRNEYSPIVSTQRPWCRGFVVLPKEAPRVPLKVAVPPKTVPRYPHMEWALATGHSKKYASSGWASYDSHFFRFAERAGYAVDLASQHDLHFSPDILDGYDCAVFVGHDEYWTWEMRDAVDSYVERGGHAARFAGNFMWQTRLEDEGRRQVCYKYRARAEDPAYRGGDVTRATNSWEAPEIGRPGSATFGLNATRGLYAGWGGCAPRGVRGFPVYRPEHWAFAGTGIYYGDLLGADSHVYGYEVDGLDFEIRGGLPYPTATSGAPDGLQVLAVGMASQVEESADIPIEDQFLTDEDGRFSAETLFGDRSDANLEKVKRGNGMIVNFPRGKGEVFHAGSCEWVAGLLRQDPMVERVTQNVLDRYLGKS